MLEWRLPTPIPPQLERSVGLTLALGAVQHWHDQEFAFRLVVDTYADGVPPSHDQWGLIARPQAANDVPIVLAREERPVHATPLSVAVTPV